MDIYKDTWQVEMPTIPSFIEDDLPYLFRTYIIPSFRAACKGARKKERQSSLLRRAAGFGGLYFRRDML